MIHFDEHIFQMGWFNHQLALILQKHTQFDVYGGLEPFLIQEEHMLSKGSLWPGWTAWSPGTEVRING